MCLSSQPALKVRLAASRKRDGKEWAWVLNVFQAASAVWAERTCEQGHLLLYSNRANKRTLKPLLADRRVEANTG